MKNKNLVTALADTTSGNAILNDNQLSALLGVKTRALREWRITRKLPFIRISSRVIRYRRSDIDTWLAGHMTNISD